MVHHSSSPLLAVSNACANKEANNDSRREVGHDIANYEDGSGRQAETDEHAPGCDWKYVIDEVR